MPRRDSAVTSLIYGYEADADSRDKDCLTPLWMATESGYVAVVKRLLDTGKVDVDSKGKGGHETVVKLLLEVDAESRVMD